MIVDSHVHLGRREHWNMEVVRTWFEPFGLSPDLVHIDPEAVIANMEEAGVAFSFALALNCKRLLDVCIPNEYVASICERYPERFVGFASVDPILGKRAVAELKDAIENMGLRGLKLGPTYQDYHPHDPKAYLVYSACEDMGVPILFHMGWTSNRLARLSYQEVVLLDEICIDFPELRVIIAHLGMPRQRDTLHLMAKHRHVYADLAARDLPSYGGGARTMFADVADAVEQEVSEKVFWGTDFPWAVPAPSIEALRSINDFADEHRPPISGVLMEGLLGGNVARFMADVGWPVPRMDRSAA